MTNSIEKPNDCMRTLSETNDAISRELYYKIEDAKNQRFLGLFCITLDRYDGREPAITVTNIPGPIFTPEDGEHLRSLLWKIAEVIKTAYHEQEEQK